MKQWRHSALACMHTLLSKLKRDRFLRGLSKAWRMCFFQDRQPASPSGTQLFWPFWCNYMLAYSIVLFTFFLFSPRFNKSSLWLLDERCFACSLLVWGSIILMLFHILDTRRGKKITSFLFPQDLYGLSPLGSSCALRLSFSSSSLWLLSLFGKCTPYICML